MDLCVLHRFSLLVQGTYMTPETAEQDDSFMHYIWLVRSQTDQSESYSGLDSAFSKNDLSGYSFRNKLLASAISSS